MGNADLNLGDAAHWSARILRWGLLIAGIAGVVWFGAKIFWLILAPTDAVGAPIAVKARASANTQTGHIVDRTALFRENRFISKVPVAADAVPDAPETNLNLKLRGARATTGQSPGAAYILTPDNRLNTYAAGDEVLNGVTIENIYNNRVILNKNGTIESLYLDGRDQELAVIGDEKTLPEQTAPEGDISMPDHTPRSVAVNGEALLAAMRIQPLIEEGNTTGYSLAPRGEPGPMLAAGLQPGDVLVGIGQDDIHDLEISDIADRLRNASELTLVLKRNDNTVRHVLTLDGTPPPTE